MKKTVIAIAICLLAFSGNAMAQKNLKLGHINSTELMQIIPGRDSAQAVLQAEVTELESTLKSMQSELETRYNDYMQNQQGWTELIRQTKQKELQDMNARIQEFGENAQKQLQERETELFKPLIERAKDAIKEVAREGGYSYIFDSGTGFLGTMSVVSGFLSSSDYYYSYDSQYGQNYYYDHSAETVLDSLAFATVYIWNICDAVKVAKVKNLYYRDLYGNSQELKLHIEPYLNFNPVANPTGNQMAGGLSLKVDF